MWLQMLRPGERGTGIGSSVEGVREIVFACLVVECWIKTIIQTIIHLRIFKTYDCMVQIFHKAPSVIFPKILSSE